MLPSPLLLLLFLLVPLECEARCVGNVFLDAEAGAVVLEGTGRQVLGVMPLPRMASEAVFSVTEVGDGTWKVVSSESTVELHCDSTTLAIVGPDPETETGSNLSYAFHTWYDPFARRVDKLLGYSMSGPQQLAVSSAHGIAVSAFTSPESSAFIPFSRLVWHMDYDRDVAVYQSNKGTYIVDIATPWLPRILSRVPNGSVRTILNNGYLYVLYGGSFFLYDARDLIRLTLVAQLRLDRCPAPSDMDVTEGIVLVACEELFIFDMRDPTAISNITLPPAGEVYQIRSSEHYIYLWRSDDVMILNVKALREIRIVDRVEGLGYSTSISVSYFNVRNNTSGNIPERFLAPSVRLAPPRQPLSSGDLKRLNYVQLMGLPIRCFRTVVGDGSTVLAAGRDRLWIIDTEAQKVVTEMGTPQPDLDPHEVLEPVPWPYSPIPPVLLYQSPIAYASFTFFTLTQVDLTVPAAPEKQKSLGDVVAGGAISGQCVYSRDGIHDHTVDNPAAPSGRYPKDVKVTAVLGAAGRFLLVGTGSTTVAILSLTEPLYPALIGSIDVGGRAVAGAVEETGIIYIVTGEKLFVAEADGNVMSSIETPHAVDIALRTVSSEKTEVYVAVGAAQGGVIVIEVVHGTAELIGILDVGVVYSVDVGADGTIHTASTVWGYSSFALNLPNVPKIEASTGVGDYFRQVGLFGAYGYANTASGVEAFPIQAPPNGLRPIGSVYKVLYAAHFTFVASSRGLFVLDASFTVVSIPVLVATDVAYSEGQLFVLAEGVLYVFTVEGMPPFPLVATFRDCGDCFKVAAAAGVSYLIGSSGTFFTYSSRSGGAIQDTLQLPTALAVADGMLVVVGWQFLHVYNLQSPVKPARVGALVTQGFGHDVVLADQTALVATDLGLWIVDVSNPEDPKHVLRVGASRLREVELVGDTAYAKDDSFAYIIPAVIKRETESQPTDAPPTVKPTPQPSTAVPRTSAPSTPRPLTTVPWTSAPSTPQSSTPQSSTAVPGTSAPSTPRPLTAVPRSSAPSTPQSSTAISGTSAPSTPRSSTAVPRTSAPSTPRPWTAVPRTSAPGTIPPTSPSTTMQPSLVQPSAAPMPSAANTQAPYPIDPTAIVPPPPLSEAPSSHTTAPGVVLTTPLPERTALSTLVPPSNAPPLTTQPEVTHHSVAPPTVQTTPAPESPSDAESLVYVILHVEGGAGAIRRKLTEFMQAVGSLIGPGELVWFCRAQTTECYNGGGDPLDGQRGTHSGTVDWEFALRLGEGVTSDPSQHKEELEAVFAPEESGGSGMGIVVAATAGGVVLLAAAVIAFSRRRRREGVRGHSVKVEMSQDALLLDEEELTASNIARNLHDDLVLE